MAPSKWTVSLVAGAVVASTLLVLRAAGVFDAPRPSARPVASAPEGPQAIAPPDSDGEPRGVPAAVDERSAAEAVHDAPEPEAATLPDRELDLFGEVVDVYGQPLAGVELRALEPARSTLTGGCVDPRDTPVVQTTTSDGEGRFRLRLQRGQQCTLEASLPGLATAHLVERRAGERVQVVLGPSATLWGRVVRAKDGAGVVGALVRLRERPATFEVRSVCREATTDSDGSYAFEGLTAGAYDPWVTCATDPGAMEPAIVLTPGQSLEHDFVLPTGLDVRGRVVDAATGEAIAGAEVSLSAWFETGVSTDVDGRFLLRGWDASAQGVGVHARAAGYADAARDLPRGAETSVEVQLDLKRGYTVVGRILGPTGAPQGDVRVELHGSPIEPGIGRDRVAVQTDADGRFEVAGLDREQGHTLVASALGAGRLVVDLPDFDPERDPRDLGDLDLPVAATLAGRVVDAEGHPVEGAYVRLQGGDPGRDRLRAPDQEPLEPFVPSLNLRLDDLGRFWARDLSRGEYTVIAFATGLSGETQATVSLREGEVRDDVELVLELGARISGRVVDSEGEPVPLASVHALPEVQGPIAQMLTRPDGSFDLRGLGEGPHMLWVEHFPGMGRRRYSEVRLTNVPSGTLDLRVILPETVPVSGVVRTVDGSALAGATVQIDHHDGLHGGMSAVQTDAQGRFQLYVPAGVPMDLVAVDWSRYYAEGSTDLDEGHVTGVQPGASDVVIRIAP